MNRLGKALLSSIFVAWSASTSLAQTPNKVNSIISNIESSPCATEIYNEVTQLSQELEKKMWIKIEDCVLKSLESIEGISDTLVWLYKNNPQQLEIDLETGLFPLLELLTWDREKIDTIIDFHEKTPNFYFGIDEVFFWDTINKTGDFPLEDLSYFLSESQEDRSNTIREMGKVVRIIYSQHFSSDDEDNINNEYSIYRQDLLTDGLPLFFKNYKTWSLKLWKDYYNWKNWADEALYINHHKFQEDIKILKQLGFWDISGVSLFQIHDIWENEMKLRLKNIYNIITKESLKLISTNSVYEVYVELIEDIPKKERKRYTERLLKINRFEDEIFRFHTAYLSWNKETLDELEGIKESNYKPVNNLERQICNHPLLEWNCDWLRSIRFLEDKYKEKPQEYLLQILNAIENQNHTYEYEDIKKMINLFLKNIFKQSESAIEDLISLIEQWWNLNPAMYQLFLEPLIKDTSEKHHRQSLYSYRLSKQQIKSYINLLSMIDLSQWWYGQNFSLSYDGIDNRNILRDDFLITSRDIYQKLWEKIRFSDLDIIWKLHKDKRSLDDFMEIDFHKLWEEVKESIAKKRKTYRILKWYSSFNHKYTGYNETASNIDELSKIELFRINMILEILENQEVRENILNSLQQDTNDIRTEYGWYIISKYPYFRIKESQHKDNDWSYSFSVRDMKYSKNIWSFHQHAIGGANIPMSYYAWPSTTDQWTSRHVKKVGFVITKISQFTFNIDYYNENWIVLDLWNYSSK